MVCSMININVNVNTKVQMLKKEENPIYFFPAYIAFCTNERNKKKMHVCLLKRTLFFFFFFF